METKTCARCKRAKPVDEFHVLKQAKDGRQYRCKTCVSEANKGRKTKGQTREPVPKRCPQCGEVKPPEAYFKNRSTVDGLQGYCKPCWTAKTIAWDAENHVAMREYNRTYSRKHRLRREYGMSVTDYDAMYDAQCGVCATCGQPETWKSNKNGRVLALAVDHCHATGKVRGLLCRRCNQLLGQVNDDSALLRRMADYLQQT